MLQARSADNFVSNPPISSKLRLTLMAMQTHLKEGDAAPDFSAAASGGGKLSLADFKGKNVILYFYPKDDTPGCTKEACAFRDAFSEFQKQGAMLLGVSPDSPASHRPTF